MSEETKNALNLVLNMLKHTLIEEGVSMAVNKENGELYFFDTYEIFHI